MRSVNPDRLQHKETSQARLRLVTLGCIRSQLTGDDKSFHSPLGNFAESKRSSSEEESPEPNPRGSRRPTAQMLRRALLMNHVSARLVWATTKGVPDMQELGAQLHWDLFFLHTTFSALPPQ